MSAGLDWGKILAATNALLALGIFVINIKLFRAMRIARVLRVMLMGIGVYWAGLYVFVVVSEPGVIDPVWFGLVFVRPAFTVTLATILACGVYRWRSK